MDERLIAVEEAAHRHELWHQDIGARMLSFESKLDENTCTTARIETGTKELLELLTSFKGAMRVLEILGKVAKPIIAITTLVGAVIALWPKR